MSEIHYIAAMRINRAGRVVEQLTTLAGDDPAAADDRMRMQVAELGWFRKEYQIATWVSDSHGDEQAEDGKDMFRRHIVHIDMHQERLGASPAEPPAEEEIESLEEGDAVDG